MNRIFKLNILYYLSFILISLSRIIIGKSITENTLYPLLILIGSYLIAFIYYKLIKKENYFNVINTTLPVLNLSCYYFTNNVIISLVLIAILSILYKFIKINYICVFYLLYLYICNKLNLKRDNGNKMGFVAISRILDDNGYTILHRERKKNKSDARRRKCIIISKD